MKDVNFDLTDADGVSHQYRVTLFSCDENVRLQLMIAGPLMQMIGRTLATVIPATGDQKMSDVFKDMESITKVLRKIDWSKAPDAMISIPEMIEQRGGAGLVQQIWANTYRILPIPELQGLATASGDGHIESDFEQHLALPAQRDAAFGDGNFAEYWQAVAMVLIANFTRYGRSGAGSLTGLAESLIAAAATPSNPNNATPPQSSGLANGSNAPPSS